MIIISSISIQCWRWAGKLEKKVHPQFRKDRQSFTDTRERVKKIQRDRQRDTSIMKEFLRSTETRAQLFFFSKRDTTRQQERRKLKFHARRAGQKRRKMKKTTSTTKRRSTWEETSTTRAFHTFKPSTETPSECKSIFNVSWDLFWLVVLLVGWCLKQQKKSQLSTRVDDSTDLLCW